jgi:hypothetical protein
MPRSRFITSQQTFYDSEGIQAVAACPLVKVPQSGRGVKSSQVEKSIILSLVCRKTVEEILHLVSPTIPALNGTTLCCNF